MMFRSLFFLVGFFATGSSFAGDVPYAFAAIPEPLLKNASVVKRMEEIELEIVSTTEMVYRHKYAQTILNENGDGQAGLVLNYNKFRSIRSFEGSLFDAQGNLVRKLKNKEIQDVSAVSDISLMEDDRIKAHHFYHKAYPYTVEYTYEFRFNSTFFLPAWRPQPIPSMSVEKSRCTLMAPADYTVRHLAFNYAGEPEGGTERNKKRTTWTARSIAARQLLFAAPVWRELTTSVYFGPSEFEIAGYKGNMNNWQEFGKFVNSLRKDRDQLPEHVAQKVKELTAGAKSEQEKVNVLYDYLQKNTRYISIQLGIGGWQPFDAAFVAQKGYGDCKALSNYMCSLLKAAGMKSYYTLVNAGAGKNEKNILYDFPAAQQFNHVILCVPLQKDTIWLECTSQTNPAGYMGEFTGNRKALLIDENGGTFAATARYGLNENLQLRAAKGKLDGEGNLEVGVVTVYKAMQQDDRHAMTTQLTKDKIKKALNEELDLSTYDILDFHYKEKRDILPQIEEDLKLYVSKFATISGKRLFIMPNLLNRSHTKLTVEEDREYDFVFDFEYRDVDTVEVTFPQGYVPEAMPQDVSLKTKFGAYTSQVKVVDNKLVYIRTREQYAGRFPAKEGAALAQYYEAIYKADRARVVLVKKEGAVALNKE